MNTRLALTLLCAIGCSNAAPQEEPPRSSGFAPDAPPLQLVDGAASDFFGYSLAVFDELALVGAPGREVAGHREQGAAYVFVREDDGWHLEDTLSADDGASSDHFGLSVALAEGMALIGAPGHAAEGDPFRGAAYVFARDGEHWTQQGRALSSSDGAAADAFGTAVALATSNGTANAIVGAPYHDVNGHSDQGAAYAFTLVDSSWAQRGEALVAGDGLAGEIFGNTVAISGSTALVGAPIHQVGANPYQGAGYVFVDDGDAWTQQAELIAADGGPFDQLSPCAIAGDTVLLGAPHHVVDNHPMRGAAYVFERHDGHWQQKGQLLAADGKDADLFGSAVALSDSAALIAAPGRNSESSGANGGVYFYAPDSQGAWRAVGPVWTSSEGAPNETFGPAVAISKDVATVGSPYRDVAENVAQGVVYPFSASVH